MSELKGSARAVQAALNAAGLDCQVLQLPDSTRSAREAASALGCRVAQIAKSIVFRGTSSGRPVLVIASGVNRVCERTIAGHLGEDIEKADAAFVRQATGFAIGGVPPCGHRSSMTVFIDRDLLALGEVWAAAGTPHAVFRLNGAQLVSLTGGRVLAVSGED